MVKSTQWEIIPVTPEETITVDEEAIIVAIVTAKVEGETFREMRTTPEAASLPAEALKKKEVRRLSTATILR